MLQSQPLTENKHGSRQVELYTLENPVFQMYLFVVAVSVAKMMYQKLLASIRMVVSGTGMQSPEDLRPGLLNPDPKLSQLSAGDYVDRPRRILQTDLEVNPAFWGVGLGFVAVNPPLLFAEILFVGFFAFRAGHWWTYERAMGLGYRALFFFPSVLIIIAMALTVVVGVVQAMMVSDLHGD